MGFWGWRGSKNEAVDPPAVACGLREPDRLVLPRRIAGGLGGPEHDVEAVRGEPDAEGPQRLLLKPTRGEVLARRRHSRRLPQVALVKSRGAVEQLVLALGPAARGGRGGILGALLAERDAVAVGEELDRTTKVQALGLLDELEDVAAGLAAEAVVELLRRVDAQARGCAPRGRRTGPASAPDPPAAAECGTRRGRRSRRRRGPAPWPARSSEQPEPPG